MTSTANNPSAACGSCPASPAPGWFWPVVAVLSLVAAWLVEQPYFALPHVHDDRHLSLLAGLVRTGRLHWSEMVLLPFDYHWVGGWMLVYLGQLWAWGLEPWPWHAVNLSAHVAIGLALAWWLMVRGIAWQGAALAAILWSGLAIGRPENPLAWIGTGCLPLGLACLMLALAAGAALVSRADRLAWWGWLGGSAAVGVLIVGAGSLFGPLLVLAPLLLLDWRIAAGSWPRLGRLWPLCSAWALGVAVIAMFELPLVLPRLAVESEGARVGAAAALGRALALHVEALATMLGWTASGNSSTQLGLKGAAAAAFAAGAGWLARRQASRLFVVAALSFVYVLLIVLGRAGDDWAQLAGSGRYLYVPSLFWCAWAGMAAGQFARTIQLGRTANRHRVWALAAAALVAAHLAQQHRVALAARTQFFDTFAAPLASWGEERATLEALAAAARNRGRSVNLPDFALLLLPEGRQPYPLSVFRAAAYPRGLPEVIVQPAESLTPEHLADALEVLDRLAAPGAQRWKQAAADSSQRQQMLAWLGRLGDERNIRLPLISDQDAAPPGRFGDYHLLAWTFADRPYYVTLVAPHDVSYQSLAEVLRALAGRDEPEAQYWRAYYGQLRERFTSGGLRRPRQPAE